jgi:hypothetical protein
MKEEDRFAWPTDQDKNENRFRTYYSKAAMRTNATIQSADIGTDVRERECDPEKLLPSKQPKIEPLTAPANVPVPA